MDWIGLNIDINSLLKLFVYDAKSPLLFNSGFFLFIFTLFLLVYYLLQNHQKAKIAYVTLFSFYFYYKCSGIFFLILVVSTVADFYLSRWIYNAPTKNKKRWLLVLSLVVNLGMLVYFKYTNFFIELINNFSSSNIKPMDIILPVGISFYTFQSLSYTIDVYRGELRPLKRFLDFCFCISFFPHLVAGPIIRASYLIPQLTKPFYVSKSDMGKAVFLIVTGLFKKAIISDYISINFVDRIFDNPQLYSGFENLMGVYGYALQIYCDFSGYSDIAIGIALLIGFKLPINFDSPYQSASVTEFWRRWHISLSTWLRDYLYIPLGGNRLGKFRQYLNLAITMLLGGLWHGASLKFVLWGMMHGIALAFEKFINSYIKVPKSVFVRFLGIIVTFHFVCFCWIFFRANTFASALDVINQIGYEFNSELVTQVVTGYKEVFLLLVVGFVLHMTPKSWELASERVVTLMPLYLKSILLVFIIWLVVQVQSSEVQPFIYFQF